MAEEETRTLDSLAELGQVAETQADAAAPEPVVDAQGRTYATGKRKDAVARVWIKPGSGKITVKGREVETYFARPTLRMNCPRLAPFPSRRRRRLSSSRRGLTSVRAALVGPSFLPCR